MKGWNFNETYTKIERYYYAQDYPMGVQFIKDIAKMDALSTKNSPSFSLSNGEILKLELYSPPL
jgi:hypothetical protein